MPDRAGRLASEQFLRAIVRGEGPGGALPPDILDLARWHGVVPLLRYARPGVPDIEAEFLRVQGERLRVLHDLPFVAETLRTYSWAVVKGPVLSEDVYAERGRRGFGDLDVLVAAEHFGKALDALEAAGAVLLDHNWELAARQRRAELSLRLPGGTVLDLHWSLLNDPRTRVAMPLPDLLVHRRPMTLGATQAWALDPVDALVHVCLHATVSGGHRLVWARDIAESLNGVRCADLWRRAEQMGLSLPVGTALVRTNAVVPIRHRTPSGLWGAAMRAAARILPPGRGPDVHPTGAALVAATRGDTKTGAGALLHRFADRSALAATAAELARPIDGGWRQRYLTALPGPRRES